MKCLTSKGEQLRREKISKTIKEKHRKGEWNAWNKGLTIKTDKRIKKLGHWLGKKNPQQSMRMKGRIPWNKGLKGYLAGEKHYNWKGGKTSENSKMHGSAEWKNWRNSVFKRDNYTCKVCLKRGVYLEAHHIKSSNYYPKLRFTVSNGITLCKKCHKEHHRLNGRKTIKKSR